MANVSKTELQIVAEKQRTLLLTKNEYSVNNQYSANHPNAKSDGDDKGKDEIGSKTDIETRISNLKFNKFNPDNKYPNFETED